MRETSSPCRTQYIHSNSPSNILHHITADLDIRSNSEAHLESQVLPLTKRTCNRCIMCNSSRLHTCNLHSGHTLHFLCHPLHKCSASHSCYSIRACRRSPPSPLRSALTRPWPLASWPPWPGQGSEAVGRTDGCVDYTSCAVDVGDD